MYLFLLVLVLFNFFYICFFPIDYSMQSIWSSAVITANEIRMSDVDVHADIFVLLVRDIRFD